ncbi:inositol 1,4,5-trisphosphate receptor-interacting protein-like [Petromyzon marinus]|uniref:Inositol 1,4,5-trisphosphate receptor-interacting protein-like n=1 Tax=Petromyzon marinus TaxID=7757 RepID=A0AAJ7XG14_PETMA|nr:inositol 1,4,5-trisphosphate receptor-interacting protein-like [Petromyzon marinus]
MMASSIELDRFYSEEVEFPPGLLASHIDTAEREVRTLLEGMRSLLRPNIDPSIQYDIVQTGSSYEGLKVKGDMELDFMIVLCHPEFKFIPITSDYSGYRKIKAEQRQPQFQLQATSWKSSSPPHSFQNDFTSNGYLLPSKIYQWFQSLADRAVNENKSKFVTKFVGNLPARTLILNIWPDVEICVDLVPAIYIGRDLFVVAKPLKTSPDPDLWRLSFSVFEKNILSRLPSSSCHLKALKILKYLREHDTRLEETSQFASGLCSYHLKTASLHLLARPAQPPDTPEGLHEHLHQLMDFLIECMQRRELNHFFMGNPSSLARNAQVPSNITDWECRLNLFGDTVMNECTLSQARERLNRIKRSLPAVIQQHSGPGTRILAPGPSPGYHDIAISRYGDIVSRRPPSFQNQANVRGPLSLHIPPPHPLQLGNLERFGQSEARTLMTSQKVAVVTRDPLRGKFAAASEGDAGGCPWLYLGCCCCLVVVCCCLFGCCYYFGLSRILSAAASVRIAGATFCDQNRGRSLRGGQTLEDIRRPAPLEAVVLCLREKNPQPASKLLLPPEGPEDLQVPAGARHSTGGDVSVREWTLLVPPEDGLPPPARASSAAAGHAGGPARAPAPADGLPH